MYYSYVIYNKERDKIYTGHTNNLEERMLRHNKILKNKKSSFTSKQSGNWNLVHKEEFETKEEAMKREKELKSYQGRKFIRDKIKNARP